MKFEVVSKYADAGISLPVRKTKGSAGYDFQVAEDIVIPSYKCTHVHNLLNEYYNLNIDKHALTLEETAALTKAAKAKPTLVPTGIKCEMPEDMYLELSVRSSCPLKHWLILANGVGIIDADYYNNPDNEGHIFFQIINLAPFDIVLEKGAAIGQGIFKKYYLTDDDAATAERQGGFGSTDNLRNYLGKWCPEGINVMKEPERPTPLERYQEECVMACNPERRAYIFKADLSSADERIERSYEQYSCT